ncbi:MAG: hypothetical protein UR96_C0015G0005 [candidate division WS6 bacterium GW2011_GWC1_36_11]|uniref:Type II toxin-antitoxin system RelE/ParE family toxin n=3 Tax=Candidatus Dojkabacteria TaxID=74243 RepID=A0A0G0DG24_9BACT|nr:MAG: hypothetical protein UR96_C0015G0005 [candidate division WS6 bacterium GW2011_GWC1_36_11]KKQ02915.1 MAG: hypothetical protein US14_C0042G0006 [candidate division WS6 bacterium GW2011_WS6_36_26]KKQ10968.1 MAG: hypothetical protein US24_C0048G0005 [candidate division WS6 bacterium GW2011_GWC2_36_7]KKQ15476.1 MAG: hypothetical protein US29_C0043G0005 [candidate division WS6 bacterium GW2011_GWF1_36_8]HAM37433.1 hypothetical protein [Patescibacteria group bacterium]
MTQYTGKDIYADSNFEKEINLFPDDIREEMYLLFSELSDYGFLEYPNAKKLSGTDLFEVRVNHNGAWRCIYAYTQNHIVLLSAFRKKTMRTPLREINICLQRLTNLKN